MGRRTRIAPTNAADRRAMLKLAWSRTNPGTGAVYSARRSTGDTYRQLTVVRIYWAVPGFSGRTGSGWAAFIDGIQHGPAHRTALAAQEHAEMRSR